MNKTSLKLTVGRSKKLTVKNKPAKAKLKWSTSNKKVATVKNGKVKAVKKGTAKITCKVTYKNKKKKVTKKLTAKVTVQAKKKNVPTPAATASNGAIATKAPAATATVAPAPTVAPTPELPKDKAELLKMSNVGEEHQSANGITTKDNGLMRKELSSQDLMPVMSLGWNLGNQMEQSNCMGNWTTQVQVTRWQHRRPSMDLRHMVSTQFVCR